MTLSNEKYLHGRRISQVCFVDNDVLIQKMPEGPLKKKNAPAKLLISIWEKPGYVLLERDPCVLHDELEMHGDEIKIDMEEEVRRSLRL